MALLIPTSTCKSRVVLMTFNYTSPDDIYQLIETHTATDQVSQSELAWVGFLVVQEIKYRGTLILIVGT